MASARNCADSACGNVEAGLLDLRAIALHVEQAERRGRFVYVAEHRAEERLVFGLAHAQARLGDEVAERHRRW